MRRGRQRWAIQYETAAELEKNLAGVRVNPSEAPSDGLGGFDGDALRGGEDGTGLPPQTSGTILRFSATNPIIHQSDGSGKFVL